MLQKEGVVLWLTGIPDSGKTTIARGLERELRGAGCPVELLDGDAVRREISPGLGFSKDDRSAHVNRLGYIASILSRHGIWVIVAAVSPYREGRDRARQRVRPFVEVFVDCPLTVAMERDAKGLYAAAKEGRVSEMTGYSDPYEPPLCPEVHLRTDQQSANESVCHVMSLLRSWEYLR